MAESPGVWRGLDNDLRRYAPIGPRAQAAEPCSRVVSYFLYPYQGSRSNRWEWRILDPSRGTDTLFLSLPEGIRGVRWDTTFDRVYFSSGDSLYRARWRLGAGPRLITRLPAGTERWWLNPDSGAWQSLRVPGWRSTTDPDRIRFEGELWKATPDGGPWRLVREDSVDLVDADSDRWQWSDGSPLPGGAPAVTLDNVAGESWEEAWGGRTAFIDTATLTVTGRDAAGIASDPWFFLGLKSAPRRGVAFRWAESLAPEHDWFGVLGPLYFVDLDRRTKVLVEGSEVGIMRSLVAEHCGLLLIPGVAGRPLVIDASGRRVFSPPWNSSGAVWVPSPRN